ncbi:hypothetical protein GH714_017286 [Hevea brasiliensis]|uniref:Protein DETOXIFICATION n=1 Tax=Hevea brasiliensis TaxID=3981 RepID=A0A6A6K682_HEVBR|nr:hypothetical protein GH714_017286 [Hevea brasiliensis]
MNGEGAVEESKVPLLGDHFGPKLEADDQDQSLTKRVWIESKKLWEIVGPAIFSRLTSYSMLVITQAFAAGMASALETLCGQAFGARKYYMLGVYMQRSWIVLFLCCVLLLPLYLFASPMLKLLGQPKDVAELSGIVSVWMIPLHSLQLCVSVSVTEILAEPAEEYSNCMGLFSGSASACDVFGHLGYTICGGCPLTWNGFSIEAFSGLWEFTKLSAASGVMLCLENWYYRILILMTGNLKNAEIAVDALSVCMTINGWEIMIPLAFFAGTGVRVANELGAGNGKGAKFATVVSVTTSIIIGLFFWVLIMIFHNQLAWIFTSSVPVLKAVSQLSVLLAFTILLNSVQPVLSGVAVGSGWQKYVAYINLGCYYLIGVPLGFMMGWLFHLGVLGIWAGMIFGGTAIQTLILAIITIRCDWEKEAEKAALHLKKWSEVE